MLRPDHDSDDRYRCDECDGVYEIGPAGTAISDPARLWVQMDCDVWLGHGYCYERRSVIALGVVHSRPCCTLDGCHPEGLAGPDRLVRVWDAATGYLLDLDDVEEAAEELLGEMRELYGIPGEHLDMRALDLTLTMRRAGAFRPQPPEVRV